jgi:hypothetical protein
MNRSFVLYQRYKVFLKSQFSQNSKSASQHVILIELTHLQAFINSGYLFDRLRTVVKVFHEVCECLVWSWLQFSSKLLHLHHRATLVKCFEVLTPCHKHKQVTRYLKSALVKDKITGVFLRLEQLNHLIDKVGGLIWVRKTGQVDGRFSCGLLLFKRTCFDLRCLFNCI